MEMSTLSSWVISLTAGLLTQQMAILIRPDGLLESNAVRLVLYHSLKLSTNQKRPTWIKYQGLELLLVMKVICIKVSHLT
jgi:hypothetical protein